MSESVIGRALHERAEKVLATAGKHPGAYTADEYLDALEQAQHEPALAPVRLTPKEREARVDRLAAVYARHLPLLDAYALAEKTVSTELRAEAQPVEMERPIDPGLPQVAAQLLAGKTLDLHARKILASRGKAMSYTAEEYVAAIAEAEQETHIRYDGKVA